MSYDEALKKIEAIVKELEQAGALSMDVYTQKAQEAKSLLDFCETQLGVMEKQLLSN